MRAELLICALLAAGCFSPSPADHVYRCNGAHACPNGYDCAGDGWCYRHGHAPATPDMAQLMSDACHDGKQDGDETGVDCGGGTCSARCPNGQGCNGGSDCKSGICNRVAFMCVASDCMDGMRDDSESDVDCGGGTCPGCAAGKACATPGDCANFLCNQTSHTCVADPCFDGVKDFSETDVDCGGSCVQKCKNGQGCNSIGDCVAGAVCTSSKCQIAHCVDGMLDNGETDIDCGGTDCSPCALGKMCLSGSDCASTFCNAMNHMCVANQCLDGVKDGQESDIDCGGMQCDKCPDGKMCSGGSDCTGDICTSMNMCCTSNHTCTSGAACGTGVDNCGQMINCGPNNGACPSSSYTCVNGCCSASAALACGSQQCGTAGDGCGVTYNCGSNNGGCQSGYYCTNSPSYLCCQSSSSACAGQPACAVVSISCNGTTTQVTCGGCASGQVCYNGACCTPSCPSPNCEVGIGNGCGGTCPVTFHCASGCCGGCCIIKGMCNC